MHGSLSASRKTIQYFFFCAPMVTRPGGTAITQVNAGIMGRIQNYCPAQMIFMQETNDECSPKIDNKDFLKSFNFYS